MKIKTYSLLPQLMNNKDSVLDDLELLKLILSLKVSEQESERLARYLLTEFDSIIDIINASRIRLRSIPGVTLDIIQCLKIIDATMNKALYSKIKNKNIINSKKDLIEYLQISMGYRQTERLRVIHLNSKNMIIANENQALGTVNMVPVYPREIVKRAVLHNATSIILIHNHPSGDQTASEADIDITRNILEACHIFDIKLHDHIIVSGNQYFSFKENKLL